MVSEDKQYEFITNRVSDLSNATEDGLKLFVPMYSAILGGSIWLRLQLKDAVPPSYKYLSDALILLLTFVCIYIVLDNLRAWWWYRQKLAEITSGSKYPATQPHWSAAIIEVVLCAAMFAAGIAFVLFNPFMVSN
jgi:hypothetical protein